MWSGSKPKSYAGSPQTQTSSQSQSIFQGAMPLLRHLWYTLWPRNNGVSSESRTLVDIKDAPNILMKFYEGNEVRYPQGYLSEIITVSILEKNVSPSLNIIQGVMPEKNVQHCLLVYATLHPAKQTGQLIPPNYASVNEWSMGGTKGILPVSSDYSASETHCSCSKNNCAFEG